LLLRNSCLGFRQRTEEIEATQHADCTACALAESIPPKLYGGTERVVAWLVDELVALGHDVTLFASGDSVTRAKLQAVWPRALRLGRPRSDPMAAQTALLEAVSRRASEFDVIHVHVDWLPLPLLSRLGVPFVTTTHGRLDLPGLSDVVRLFPNAPYVSISKNQSSALADANWIGTVYHGLHRDLFRPSFERGSYLAFLGRITAEKGPDVAIRIARAAKMPLRIAAKVPRGERAYFKEMLEQSDRWQTGPADRRSQRSDEGGVFGGRCCAAVPD